MSLPNMTRLEKEMQETPGKPEAVTLRDGTTVTIRPVRPDDAHRLQALFYRLSPESISLRFLGQPKELPYEQAEQLANVDYDFARRTFPPTTFRVTVAEFNKRAQRVWEKAGFQPMQTFQRSGDGMPFVILAHPLPERHP